MLTKLNKTVKQRITNKFVAWQKIEMTIRNFSEISQFFLSLSMFYLEVITLKVPRETIVVLGKKERPWFTIWSGVTFLTLWP